MGIWEYAKGLDFIDAHFETHLGYESKNIPEWAPVEDSYFLPISRDCQWKD